MNPPIIVIGSSNVDLIMKMDHLPKRGESVTNAEFAQTFGGKGANQAVAAARSGGAVAFVNCVGDDPYGEQIIRNLQAAGVDTQYVSRETGIASGTALIMVGGSGENYLSIAPGANYRLTPAHVERAAGLLDEAGMVIFQYEITQETLEYSIELAKQRGCKVMFNLAPARPLDERCLAGMYLLVVNESEAELLCGCAVEDSASVQSAAEKLLGKGVEGVIITLGAQGSYVASGVLRAFVPAFRVKAVDTTAAGDVFCGALATALVEGMPLLEGVRFASAASAISVTRLGAQPSIPTRAEIEEFLDRCSG
jgi:ribokinase